MKESSVQEAVVSMKGGPLHAGGCLHNCSQVYGKGHVHEGGLLHEGSHVQEGVMCIQRACMNGRQVLAPRRPMAWNCKEHRMMWCEGF